MARERLAAAQAAEAAAQARRAAADRPAPTRTHPLPPGWSQWWLPCPFQRLGLAAGASSATARAAFRKLVLAMHPDKCEHPHAPHAFAAIRDALDQLGRDRA